MHDQYMDKLTLTRTVMHGFVVPQDHRKPSS